MRSFTITAITKQRLNQSDYLLVAANLVPVFGVWLEGWSAKEAFIVYALETIIMGVLTVIKLGIAAFYRKTDWWYNNNTVTRVPALLFILFFILHFGLFVAVQSSLFAATANVNPPGTGILYFFTHWYTFVNPEVGFMLAAFIVGYAANDLLPFVVHRDYKYVSMMRLMFQPYGRIFIQQFIVILGSMFLALGMDKIFILVFALVKIFFVVYLHIDKIINRTTARLEKESGK